MKKNQYTPLNNLIYQTIITLSIPLSAAIIKYIFNFIKNSKIPFIDIGEYDNSYNNINKLLYETNPKAYNKHRIPTVYKEYYELHSNVSYFIKLNKNNYIKVDTSHQQRKNNLFSENRLKLSFFGKDGLEIRKNFIKDSNKIINKDFITVKCHCDEKIITNNVIPHQFNNIILRQATKNNIINGLEFWRKTKNWYKNHELVHKIGILLYGKPGTGKSTIAKAISCMFNNAPIIIINPDYMVTSIKAIINKRIASNDTIIVLIEDFDLYFKSREETKNTELDINEKKKKDNNQNLLFQLLDGVYSTDNTIYIATTNYKDRLDPALIRYGRFDIQEELEYFNYEESLQFMKLFEYDKSILDSWNLKYPIQPALLQNRLIEYRNSKIIVK